MNASRRDRLNTALVLLHRVESILEQVYDEEKDSMDNMPENLQSSDRYMAMENAANYIEDAAENVHDASRNVEGAINER